LEGSGLSLIVPMPERAAGIGVRGLRVGERRRALELFLERHADDTADAAFLAGIAMIERACAAARESVEFRWRSWPRGEFRRLRGSIRLGLLICRFAVLTREADQERWDEATAAARMLEELNARARRRAQTLPAQEARLENARRRREERP